MALTAGNLVFYGPLTILFKTADEETTTYTAIKGESVSVGIETKKGNVVFEDGTEDDWEEGRKLTLEMTISEFDPSSDGDMDDLEGCDNCVITMLNGKVATIGTTMRFFTDLDGGKMKITGFKAVAIGTNMSDLVAIT